MKWTIQNWIKLSLINLFIIASLGVLMRYKIGFDFPYLNQKNIQHAHSHFAFSGWITHSIYVLLVYFLSNKIGQLSVKKYNILLIVNLICSYGMLISFFFSGYSVISIALSTLTIVNSCFFTYILFKDFKVIKEYNPSLAWFKVGMIFNLISSVGTFYLAYMMASRNFNEYLYLAAVYFYLHFQYNGFFTFSCFGFAIFKLPEFIPSFTYNKNLFKLFFASCIPAYFLSTLWAKLPMWLYILTVIAAFVQFIAWILFLKEIKKSYKENNSFTKFSKIMLLFICIAFTIKLLLQLGSIIPELSKLAFGFRPVVIAYLHLVLLAFLSIFLLAYFYMTKLIQQSSYTIKALSVFLIGVFLNELALATQGLASFSYIPIKYINEILFFISLILLTGSIMVVVSQLKKEQITT